MKALKRAWSGGREDSWVEGREESGEVGWGGGCSWSGLGSLESEVGSLGGSSAFGSLGGCCAGGGVPGVVDWLLLWPRMLQHWKHFDSARLWRAPARKAAGHVGCSERVAGLRRSTSSRGVGLTSTWRAARGGIVRLRPRKGAR